MCFQLRQYRFHRFLAQLIGRQTGRDAQAFKEAAGALYFTFGIALFVVFLVLAAQFESFVHPLTILVAVALSFTGALVALHAEPSAPNMGR